MKRILTITFIFFLISKTSFNQTIDLNIDIYKEYQAIEGFGAAVASWLFSPNNTTTVADLAVNDLGMTMLRVYPEPGFEPSNENSDPNNTVLSSFNLAGVSDQFEVVSKFVNAGLNDVILSTFSPPAWMKYNNSLVGDNCLANAPSCLNRLRHDMYDEYAEYFSTYIDYIEDQTGANIYAISPENEPAWGQWYNSCVFSYEEMKDIINVLGARFEDDGIDTKIFAAEDLIRSFGEYEEVMMEDSSCRNYTDIFATHSYADGISPLSISEAASTWASAQEFTAEYEKSLWMTETSGYSDVWSDGGLMYAQLIHTALKYGNVSGWIYLNVSTYPGSQEDRALMVNNTPQKIFYVSKQFYRYIRPGSYMVDCIDDEQSQVFATAFRHGEESRMTVLALNTSSSSKTVNIVMDNKPGVFTHYRTTNGEDCITVGTTDGTNITLTPQSINTFVSEGDNKMPVIDKINDIVLLMNSTNNYGINLSGISDGDADKTQNLQITVESSNTTLIPTPVVNYTSDQDTGSLTLLPQADQYGTSTITITVTDDGSQSNNNFFTVRKISFDVKILPFINIPPDNDDIADLSTNISEELLTYEITGINDGNDGSQIVTSVEAVSSDPSVVNVTAIYNTGGNTAQLYYSTIKTGVVTITLTIKDDGGTDLGGNDTKIVTFTITVEDEVVNDISIMGSKIVIYPNPANSIVTIQSGKEINTICLVNTQGQLVKERIILNSTHKNINISEISTGYYWLKVDFIDGTNKIFPIIKE